VAVSKVAEIVTNQVLAVVLVEEIEEESVNSLLINC
jgi:hypothetical protein